MANERRHDLDWLRVIAIIAVFFLHTTHFFDEGTSWHLVNAEQSRIMFVIRALIDVWVIPLLFLLSGAGSWFALRKLDAKGFLIERAKRLLIPFYTIGILILLPPQYYFDLVTHQHYKGTVWSLIPPFIGGSFRPIFSPFMFINIWPGHLWFLQFLFLICAITLPALIYLRSDKGKVLIDGVAGVVSRAGGVFLLLVPLVAIRVGLTHFFTGEHTWADFLYFIVFFLIGYMMPADYRFTESFKRHAWACLFLGIAGIAGGLAFLAVLGYDLGNEPFSLKYVAFQTFIALVNFSFVVVALNLGARYLNFTNAWLRYANEAVLPFYILHQTVILIVGWYVIKTPMAIFPKFAVISVVSFVIIICIYELLVRHLDPVRVLFGMRPKARKSS